MQDSYATSHINRQNCEGKVKEESCEAWLTLLKSGLKMASAFGVAITGRSGIFLERGVKVFTWQ